MGVIYKKLSWKCEFPEKWPTDGRTYFRTQINLRLMFLVCSGKTSVMHYQTSQLTRSKGRNGTSDNKQCVRSRAILQHAALVVLMTDETAM